MHKRDILKRAKWYYKHSLQAKHFIPFCVALNRYKIL